jgi:hypothetical protein
MKDFAHIGLIISPKPLKTALSGRLFEFSSKTFWFALESGYNCSSNLKTGAPGARQRT